jgi:hypothetical protein
VAVTRTSPIGRARLALAGAAAAALAGASLAQAEPVKLAQMTLGYTYFNRPSAGLADHARDVKACASVAGAMRSFAAIMAANTIASPPAFGGVGYRQDRSLASASLENCMVVRGWRVVRLPEDEGRALAALEPAELLKRIEPWIGAEAPHGAVVRNWNNDAAHGATERFDTAPSRTKNGQLSLLAAAPELRQLPPPAAQEPPSPWINPRWHLDLLKPADLPTVRPDAAMLLVQVDGGPLSYRGMIFNRQGADKDSWPSARDHAPDRVFAAKYLFAHQKMTAIVVPPGRWRIYGLGLSPILNLCLGSPSFEIKAGEIVYAGEFDLSRDDVSPNLDLAPAQAWLAGQNRKITPAAYANGSLGPCGDNSIYALEFKDAPFEPGYAWGSRAAAPTPAAAR